MNSFYREDELILLGFATIGSNVLLSRKASIYGAGNISIGNNVRIDDFCILSGNITLGNYIHIAAYTALYGGSVGIKIDDFSNISSRICIYSVSDDYSGETMTNPMVPNKYKNMANEPVHIKKHCILGTGCTVLPGVTIEEGGSFGSMTLIKTDTEPWSIYVGIPARKIRQRSMSLLELEYKFCKEMEKQILRGVSFEYV